MLWPEKFPRERLEEIYQEYADQDYEEGYSQEYLNYLRTVQLPATANHHSSMLQDIRNGRETEIDFMNGQVVRLGERQGVDTPTNRMLVDLIRFKTAQFC